MDFDEAIPYSIQRAVALEGGKTFELKDLFTGVEWNDFSNGDRRLLGMRFKREVTSGRVASVSYIDNSKPARYCKRV